MRLKPHAAEKQSLLRPSVVMSPGPVAHLLACRGGRAMLRDAKSLLQRWKMQHHAGGHGNRGQDPGEQGPSIPVPPHFASVCVFAGCLDFGGAQTERRLGESMVFLIAAMSMLRLDHFSSLATVYMVGSCWPRRVLVPLFRGPPQWSCRPCWAFHRHKPPAFVEKNQEKGWLFAKLCISWFILPPHSAMHNEKGKTPSTFPLPSPPFPFSCR